MVIPSKTPKNLIIKSLLQNTNVRNTVSFLEKLIPYRLRENLRQWLLRDVHEQEFHLFVKLQEEPGLLLDIGANRGHAAISVLRHTLQFRVLSLEPNPALRWSLSLIRLLHPFRFRFRLIGAGDRSGSAELVIPTGPEDMSSQATLDPSEFEKTYIQDRLATQGHSGRNGSFNKVQVNIFRVDDLNLIPDVVKLDVEGWEAQALRGMSETLKTFRPMLIIEINNIERWAPELQALGYQFFTLEQSRFVRHEKWAEIPGLNLICMHPKTPSKAARLMAPVHGLTPIY